MVIFENGAVPRPGSTLLQVQGIDQKIWSEVHQAIHIQRRVIQVQRLQTSEVHRVPWLNCVCLFYGLTFQSVEVFR